VSCIRSVAIRTYVLAGAPSKVMQTIKADHFAIHCTSTIALNSSNTLYHAPLITFHLIMPTWKKTYSASPVDSTGNSPMQTPWISHSWRRIPFRTLLCILSGFLGMIVALCVSIEANGSRVDHWNISPTVLVSICATFSVMMVRAAFRSGADLFWWSTLCSERGVSLRALHVIWDLAHNSTSLATPSSLKANLQPLLRCAGSVVLLMGVVGPFLQRAITVELGVENTSGNVHLPIRRQPMWNLTTLGSPEAGWQWNIQPYENVFAEVAKEYQQRQPIALRQADVCPANSTCTTSVVVAGFHRACNESLVPSANISSLQSARVITLGQDRTYYCTTTGALSEGYCSNFETRFQLDLNQVYPPPKESPDPLSNPWLLPEDLGLDNDLPPAVLNYTSYTRQDTLTNLISVRNCAFTTAFVALPIEITDRNKVTLQHSQSDGSQDRGVDPSSLGLIGKERLVEVIPCPFTWAPNHSILDGFVQITMDLYGGLTLLDHNEGGTQVVQGLGARQFVNQSSFIKTNERGQVGIDVAYVDPIDVVTNTLDEKSSFGSSKQGCPRELHVSLWSYRSSGQPKTCSYVNGNCNSARTRCRDPDIFHCRTLQGQLCLHYCRGWMCFRGEHTHLCTSSILDTTWARGVDVPIGNC
jgi:hypothetical protein